jgi:hypothetical protein
MSREGALSRPNFGKASAELAIDIKQMRTSGNRPIVPSLTETRENGGNIAQLARLYALDFTTKVLVLLYHDAFLALVWLKLCQRGQLRLVDFHAKVWRSFNAVIPDNALCAFPGGRPVLLGMAKAS